MDLFDGLKTEYHLFDALRRRWMPVMPRKATEEEAAAMNEYFVKSFCPHFQWVKREEQPVKKYAIKR